ncbi:MAG: hypothetical protein QOG20_2277 [Pseudonocardiales bacterium]|jgi:hypothetical protein|uniref:hypothetical protein n=1 Tax=Pseudonocardia sp. TaxID=60912 RepID=UPI002635C437|nr:hypothetical protein [Pseudonocardia sp.]MCW2719054.1 hypothetical protein [Pseudonocardia sp.]MDT7614170.1 hypothetical protein [Pseudonocardiales bacterium]MDT7706670.1 hypothetical protein [Pseudonocardiales bacterium]
MPDAHQPRLARIACHAGCRADTARRAHHDRLLAVETDQDAVLELFDLAVTWHELEYSDEDMVAPHRWLEFAERHRWQDQDRVARIFGLAIDIAMRARPDAPAAPLSMAAGSGICPTLVPPTPASARPTHLTVARP